MEIQGAIKKYTAIDYLHDLKCFLKNIQFTYTMYIWVYMAIFIVFMIPLFINYLFLKNSGEFLSAKEIFEAQNISRKSKIIYGSAIFNNFMELKLYAFEKKKPKVIVFGSSRALEFRESFFSQSFYNMGYIVGSIREALFITPLMLEKHRPEMILMSVDFWWFNNRHSERDYELSFKQDKNVIDLAHLILPFKWLKEGKILPKQLFKLPSEPHIGVNGKLKKTGIDQDGSYYYTDTITGQNSEFKDIKFARTLSDVQSGNNRFEHLSKASDLHFKKFLTLIEDLKAKKIKIVLFLPPLAPSVVEEMKKFNYTYIQDLKNKFSAHGLTVYDFTNPREIFPETSDCEFIDGFHGGDVFYARILNYIQSKEQDLEPYINKQYLADTIKHHSGLAMIPDLKLTKNKEVDFLFSGCQKATGL